MAQQLTDPHQIAGVRALANLIGHTVPSTLRPGAAAELVEAAARVRSQLTDKTNGPAAEAIDEFTAKWSPTDAGPQGDDLVTDVRRLATALTGIKDQEHRG